MARTTEAATIRADNRASRCGLPGYLLAATLVRLADEGARVGLVLLTLDRTQSAGVGGALVAALLIPQVVAAPAVGWLTDRARRPRVVLTAAAFGFAVTLAAGALLVGRVPLPYVLAVMVVGGCCGPALTGALTSQLARLVSTERLPRAYGADSLTYNVSGIAGPAVAATVAGIWDPAVATVALALAATTGGLVLLVSPAGRAPVGGPSTPPPLSAGITAIVRDHTLATVTTASALGQLGPGALAVVAAVLASAQGRPSATGWLLSAVAVGGLIGSLWWTWRPGAAGRSPRTVMLALAGIGSPLALAATTTQSLPLTAGLFALSGVFLGPFTGALFTTRQHRAPADAQAQVFTISAGLKTTGAAVGAALGGAVAGLPVTVQLLLVGASPLLAAAFGGASLAMRSRRRR